MKKKRCSPKSQYMFLRIWLVNADTVALPGDCARCEVCLLAATALGE